MMDNFKKNKGMNNHGTSEKEGKSGKCKFTPEDDVRLVQLVMSRADRDWIWISQQMVNRNPRQCRERWHNYLDPSLQRGGWTPEEDKLLIEKKKEMGPHWNAIARFFSGRSGNSIRNRWLLILRHEEKMNEKSISTEDSSRKSEAEPSSTTANTSNGKQPTIDDYIDTLFKPSHPVDIFSTTGNDSAMFVGYL